jgi:protein-S-isoprenylcysteine O-methyltransferase Ste14
MVQPTSRSLLARSIAAFVVLPGTMAFAIPILIGATVGRPTGSAVIALIFLVCGTSSLLWCVREFYSVGRGTLAPWSPPQRLVTTGPYRFSRNPMYVSVCTILVGWCALWGSRTLIVYTAVVACAIYVRVLLVEERSAARSFGAEWAAYRSRVPRWLL